MAQAEVIKWFKLRQILDIYGVYLPVVTRIEYEHGMVDEEVRHAE